MSPTLDARHVSVLGMLRAGLEGSGVRWAITGSVCFALQGVKVAVHDVDVQTDERGAYEIERRFAAYVTRAVAFSTTERIRSHFGSLAIDSITVEIMGDIQKRRADGSWDDPVPLERYVHTVEFAGLRIPVLSLEYEYQAYLQLGRVETAAMLRRWLDERREAGNERQEQRLEDAR